MPCPTLSHKHCFQAREQDEWATLVHLSQRDSLAQVRAACQETRRARLQAESAYCVEIQRLQTGVAKRDEVFAKSEARCKVAETQNAELRAQLSQSEKQCTWAMQEVCDTFGPHSSTHPPPPPCTR